MFCGCPEIQHKSFIASTVTPVCLALLFAFSALVSAQTDCIDGVAGNFTCKDISLLSHMPLNQLGQGLEGVTSNWGWKDLQTGRYYVIQGSFSSEIFVEVTDPKNPVVVGAMPSTIGRPYSRDAETYSNHAFVVADIVGHGMQVFDLTRLRGIESPQIFEPDALYTGIGGAINIAINEETGFAYLVSGSGSGECGGGLHIVDIRTPKSPTQVACYGLAGSINETQCVVYAGPDPDHQGSEICFAAANPRMSTPNLSIINVSDKNDIRLLGQTTWPDAGFAHQGWLSEDQRYFLMGDELDELNTGMNTRTIVLDVSNLESPFYVGSHFADTLTVDHNLYSKGNFVYQANMAVGVRILRIDSLAAAEFTEVAWFDTLPANDNVSRINLGAWNAYPFFDNGTLLVSDTRSGLFMLRANLGNEFRINAGLNDAWYNPATNGQGFLISVFPDRREIFLAWFTFDTERPPEDVTAFLGEPGHRWLTAQGPYEGDTANLTIFMTEGGVFDSAEPAASTDPAGDGSMTIEFADCENGLVNYEITSLDISGVIPIQRITPDNVALCETLASP